MGRRLSRCSGGSTSRSAAGQTVAVVGRTGSGKSTLLSLIPRLIDPPEGALFVDGIDVRRLPLARLRSAIGMVPQETFLFSATIRENIAFGRPEASREEVAEAARLAGLEPDLAAFPSGLDTVVGERGLTLSGGQKQRVALARALLREPRILLLDDCLSAVDTQTEEQILRNLRTVFRGRTVFLVSHRISTVKDADLIVVLDHGRIFERGTHAPAHRHRRPLRRAPPAPAPGGGAGSGIASLITGMGGPGHEGRDHRRDGSDRERGGTRSGERGA